MNIAIIYICTAGAQMAIAPVPPQMGPQGPRLPQMGKIHRINENIQDVMRIKYFFFLFLENNFIMEKREIFMVDRQRADDFRGEEG